MRIDQLFNTRDTLQLAYLDWLNYFLTVGGFASYYGLSIERAHRIINAGRLIHIRRTRS
jgi:hypothetical protein